MPNASWIKQLWPRYRCLQARIRNGAVFQTATELIDGIHTYGSPSQLWVYLLFDRRKEAVEVEMHDANILKLTHCFAASVQC